MSKRWAIIVILVIMLATAMVIMRMNTLEDERNMDMTLDARATEMFRGVR